MVYHNVLKAHWKISPQKERNKQLAIGAHSFWTLQQNCCSPLTLSSLFVPSSSANFLFTLRYSLYLSLFEWFGFSLTLQESKDYKCSSLKNKNFRNHNGYTSSYNLRIGMRKFGSNIKLSSIHTLVFSLSHRLNVSVSLWHSMNQRITSVVP